MKKITIIGLFCEGMEVSDGQSIKTRIVTQELERMLGAINVRRIDTFGWKRNPLKLFLRCIGAVRTSENVMFLTDEGGIKVFPWLLQVANVFGKTKIYYNVIGGWLPESLKTRKMRTWWLKKLDGIYVETATMKRALESAGLKNVYIIRNCKRLEVLSEEDLVYSEQEPFGLCTFSRVMKEKGIQDAVEAVCAVNSRAGRTVYTLDIYGQVDSHQEDWFAQLKHSFPEYVRYCGTVPYQQSVNTLKRYFALLFPTKFYTEGIPGTIIDAYAAGIPIIASKWESFDDVMSAQTCVAYAFDDENGLVNALEEAAANPAILNSKKATCLQYARAYTPEAVMDALMEKLSAEG